MTDQHGDTTFRGCFLSAFRNLAGPGLLLAMGSALLMNRSALGSGMDIAFIVVAVVNVIAGLLYKPSEETPKAGTGHAKGMSRTGFVAAIVAVSVAFWVLTHFVLRR